MKEKDLLTCYKAFANLYGAILDKDAFVIINKFFPEFTYEELLKDLKKRCRKRDTFCVKQMKDGSFVIRRQINDREMKKIFLLQGDKPFYIPTSFHELKKYVYYINVNLHTDSIVKTISSLLVKYFDFYDKDYAESLAYAGALDIQYYVINNYYIHDVTEYMNKVMGICFSKQDEDEFLNYYQQLVLETRTPGDRGFTNREINYCYHYDKLLRPILNKDDDNFIFGKDLGEEDVKILFNMIDNATTFSVEEKVKLKGIVVAQSNSLAAAA